jgi:hypothetical protein
MDSAVTTGAFTLGGVVVGGGLDWARASLAAKHAKASERDGLIAALDAACISLMTEARTWRTLDSSRSKVKQIAFGMLESGLPELPASGHASPAAIDVVYTFVRWLGAGAAKRLQDQTPVAAADNIRRTVMPLLSEVAALAVRLSMTDDEGVKAAASRVGAAAGELLQNITEAGAQYVKREEAVQSAIGQLRRARDAANAGPWRRRRRRELGRGSS